MPEKSTQSRSHSLSVPWDDVVRFVRQLTHDLRNDLNALELQSAYIAELTQDQELQTEIKRLRQVTSTLYSTLQRLSRAVGEITPNMISYRAPEFLADMRAEIERKFSIKPTKLIGTHNFRTWSCTLIRNFYRKCLRSFLPMPSSMIAATARCWPVPGSTMTDYYSLCTNQRLLLTRPHKIGGANRSGT